MLSITMRWMLFSNQWEFREQTLQIEPGSKRAKVQIELKGGVQISAADFGDIPDVSMFSHNGEPFLALTNHDILLKLAGRSCCQCSTLSSCERLFNMIKMHNAGRSERYV